MTTDDFIKDNPFYCSDKEDVGLSICSKQCIICKDINTLTTEKNP